MTLLKHLSGDLFAYADDRGWLSLLELRVGQCVVLKKIDLASAVRDLAWHPSGQIYAVLERRQLVVLKVPTLEIDQVQDGVSSCVAVSRTGQVTSGRWKEDQLRAMCYVGSGDDLVSVDASGSVKLHTSKRDELLHQAKVGLGEIESYVFDCPRRQLFVVVQSALSDGRGFVESEICEFTYSGALLQRKRHSLAVVRAVTSTEHATVCYASGGLIDLSSDVVIKPASGYPFVVLQAMPPPSLDFFGVRSDNSLAFLTVT